MKSIGRILVFAVAFAPIVSMGGWVIEQNSLYQGDLIFSVTRYNMDELHNEIVSVCGCNKSVVNGSIPSSIDVTYHEYARDEYGSIIFDENGLATYIYQIINLSVKNIASGAFQDCTLLQSVSIPDSVTNIKASAFYNCSSLQSVSMPNVTSIGDSTFYGCSSLQSVSMPNVTSIEYNAFSDCSSLQSIAIPSGVTSIESATFSRCTSLESVTIGDSVGSIGSKAFYGCSSLAEVTIPASVTNIALDAFMSCDGLQRFIVDSANPVYASYDGALYTKDLKTLIIYPGGRTDVKLPSGALAAKEDAFTGCEKLWAEWYRTFQKTRYDLTNSMEDRAIASVTVNADTYLGSFVLKEGKVYDSVIYINNVSGSQVKVSLPEGNIYKTFKGAAPLTLPGHSTSILTVTRVAGGSGDNVFLVTREELEDVK